MCLQQQISILEWFLKDHVTLTTGVMMLKIIWSNKCSLIEYKRLLSKALRNLSDPKHLNRRVSYVLMNVLNESVWTAVIIVVFKEYLCTVASLFLWCFRLSPEAGDCYARGSEHAAVYSLRAGSAYRLAAGTTGEKGRSAQHSKWPARWEGTTDIYTLKHILFFVY